MSLTCEICGRQFPTNTSLYVHKQTQHSQPKLLLMNHNHDDANKNHDEHDSGLKVIDEYKFDKKKRKRLNNDSKPKPKKTKNDVFEIIDEYNDGDTIDDNFQVIDEYNDNDGQDDKNLKIIDQYDDDGYDSANLNVIDEYNDDGQSDKSLEIVDRYDRKKKVTYKRLYKECIKSERRLRERIKKIVHLKNKSHRENKITSNKALQQQELQFNKQITDLNDKYKENISEVKHECEQQIKDLNLQHKKEYEDLEENCEKKIKKLTDHIKSLEEDDASLNTLNKAIFNCTSIQEISEIMRLVKNHQIDIVVQRHLKTLQNLFLSLSLGVLPICQPQRDKITDSQREMVEKLQSLSANRAKGVLKENRNELINLFTIIEGSLKLARDSYNKYTANTI